MAEEAEAEENKHKFRGVVLSLISDYETQFNCSSSKTVVHQGSKSDSCRLRERWRCFAALYFLDVVFSISIIGPAVVFIWRGVWDGGVLVAGEYGVSQTVSNTSAFLIGFIVTLLIDLFHSEIRSIGGKPGSIRHHIAHRMYSLCWGVFDICFWKGIWDGINHFGGKTWHFSLATLVLGIVILTISGVLKSSLSIPIGISVYDPEHHISCTTFLNANRKQSSSRWFADGLVSRGLELFVVLSWHGMWSLIDIITDKCFGLSFEHSTLVSLVLGLVGVLILLFLQVSNHLEWDGHLIFSWQPLHQLLHSSPYRLGCSTSMRLLFLYACRPLRG